MEKTRLGKTELMVSRTSFGSIPIQRISYEESTNLLRKAYNSGVNFYDTARAYGTSENRIGTALSDVRDKIIIATKTLAKTGQDLRADLEKSLSELNTDYIDIYQLHNPSFVPRPGEADGLYDEALKAKQEGLIRHIGVTSHSLETATEMAISGLYETMQFQVNTLSTDDELKIIDLCKEHDVGFIAMKAMAGGFISNAKSAFAFMRQFDNVVPIWGVQFMWELEEFLGYENNPPELNDEIWEIINKDRKELAHDFCRCCGYCMPCPVDINIPMACRAELMIKRVVVSNLVNEGNIAMMRRINDCTSCNHCIKHCPYNLDTPSILRKQLNYFEAFLKDYEAKNA